MPSFDFRILLETVEGNKSSYYSSSFVNTDNDGLVLSASQVYHRITGSVSASYQNQSFFSGSDVNPNFVFKNNSVLSASLVGDLNTGSIDFAATTDVYDRLLRYKFFGEKVCNVLGLPHAQWIYVDQFSLNPDNENNFFEGNVNAQNLFIGDSMTFANDSTIGSDIPFLIDTGSDRHIKFIDERDFGTRALIMGYDKSLDVYEISGSNDKNFNIGGVDRIIFSDGTTQTSAGGGGAGTVAGSDTQVQFNSSGNFAADADLTFNGDTLSTTFLSTTNITASGNISASGANSTFGKVVNVVGTDPRLRLKAVGANHPGVEWHEDSTRKWVLFNDPDESDKLVFKNDTTELLKLTQDGHLGVTEEIYHIDDTDTKIVFTADDINFQVGGVNFIDLTEGSTNEITFNEAGAASSVDIDFRVEGTGDANLLFTDAGNDKVGIGTNSPSKKLHVVGAISASQNIFIGTGTGTDEKKIIHSGDEDTHLLFDQNKVNLVAGGSSAIKLEKSTGKIFINNTNDDLDTQIMADDGEVILHTDAGTNRVGIGTTTPTTALQVTGDISASGNVIATQYIVNSTVTNITQSFSSGSTIFGDTPADDTHKFTGSLDISGSGTDLTVNGKVGIGTTSPDSLLTITGSSKKMLSISSSFAGPSGISVARNSGDRIDLFANYSGYGGGLNSTDALRFSTNDSGFNSPSMYIETDGKVGIGTTSPSRLLHISSSGVARVVIDGQGGSNARLHFAEGGDDRWNIGNAVGDKSFTFYDGDNAIVKFYSGSNSANTLVVSGSKVGIGTTSPDSKLHISYNDSTTEGSVTNNFNDVGLQIENTNADGVAAIQFRSSDADGYIFYDDTGTNAGDFHFKTDGGDGASVLTLKDGGNVGIGTETPSASLEVWSENSQEYHYPLIIRNPYNNNVPNNNYGVGMKFHLDDANQNKFAAISYEANTAYGNDGYLRFFVDGTGLTTTPSSSQAQLSLASNGNITASGNISASGTGHFSDLNITHGGTAITFNRDGHESVTIGQGNADRFFIRNINDARNDLVILDDGKTAIGGNDAPTRQLVVAGTISGSGDLDIVGNITGSGGRFNSNVGIGPDDYIPSRLLDLSGSNGNGEMILVRGNKDAGGTIRYQRGTSYSWRAGVGGGSSTDSNIPSSFWGIEDVSDSNTPGLVVAHSTQNVGIGTTSPDEKLDVNGKIVITSGSTVGDYVTTNFALRKGSNGEGILDAPGHILLNIDTNDNNTDRYFGITKDAGTEIFRVQEDGRVGIGTTSPGDLLHVSGGNGTEVIIEGSSAGEAKVLAVRNNLANDTTDDSVSIQFSPDNRQDNAARIIVGKDGDFSTGANIDTNMQFVTVRNNSSNEVLRLTSDEKVGIGTNPHEKLHLKDDNHLQVKLDSSAGSDKDITLRLTSSAQTWDFKQYAQGNLNNYQYGMHLVDVTNSSKVPFSVFPNTDSKTLVLSGSGNVGIGTSNPVSSLHVEEGDIRIDTAENGTQALRFSDRNTTKAQIQYVDNGEKLHILTGGSTKAISIDNSQNVGIGTDSPTEVLDVNGNIKTTGNVSSPTFESGFAGSGFRITSGSDGKQTFTIDDLTVRGTMNVYEMLINQVRATNGSLFVSSTGKVEVMSGSISSSAVVTGSGFLSNYPSGLATSSLLAHYTFNDGGKTPIQDYSGNANTGSASLSTNLSTDAGYLGMGARFVSSSYDHIMLPSTISETNIQQFSIAMWVNRGITINDGSSTYHQLVHSTAGSFIIIESAGSVTFRVPGVSTSFNPNSHAGRLIPSGSWTHLVCTYNQATASVYVNGIASTTGSRMGPGTVDFDAELAIGADPDGHSQTRNFEGRIDDFRFYTGSLNAAEVESLFSGSEGVLLQTGDDTNHGFDEGDVIRAQRFSGKETFQSDMIVTRVDSTTKFSAEPHSAVKPDTGFEYVRLGNTFDTNRQGAVYLTADDDDAPFIDIVDGVTKHSEFNTSGKVKTRIGKLDGITTANPAFGTLSGFGFYASGSAFLEGGINATSGAIGDFIIDNTEIRDTNNDLRLKSSGQITGSKVLFNGGTIGGFTIDAHSLTSTGIEINDSTQGTFISSSNFKVSHTGDVTASNVDLSGKITATDGEIGGFTIDEDEIKAGSTLILDSDTNSGEIKLGGASDITTGDGIYMAGDKKFRVGQASDNFIRFNNTANVLEIKTPSLLLDSSGNLTVSGTLSSSVGNIGGFTIDSSEIKSNNASGETGLRLKAGGQITASNAKITGDITATSGEFSGDVIATHINTTSGSIGGFVIGSSAISSSNLALSSSNGGRIVLGSNEETILSGSGEGQFAGGNFSFDKSGNVTIANAELSLPVLKPSSEFFDVANSKFVCLISGSNGAVDAEIGFGTFESNTTITILGTGSNADMNRPIKETIFVENAYTSGSIANTSLNFGDIIEADKPITLVESAFGTVGKGKEGTPLNFAAKQFLTYGDRRQPVQVNMYSPFAQGSVTMSVHSSSLTDPYGGDYQPHTSGTIEADGTLRLYGSASAGIQNDEAERYAYLIESTVPIVAQSTGVGTNDNDDTTVLMPLDSVIHNVDSGNDISIRLTTDMAQKIFTAVTSSVTGTALVTPGEEGSARGQVITSSNNALFQYHLTGDGAGTDAVQGIGSNTIGDTYIIPHPVGGVQILSSEPAIISCSRMNGDGTLTAFFACDHSAASVTSPLGFTTGSVSHGYDEEDTDGSSISQSLSPVGLYIEGTGNFALRTNTFGDDEYTPLGYRRNAVTSYNQNVRYFFEPANTTTITGDRIKTGKIQSNNLSTTVGSEFNLNDGTFKLGGTSNPDLQFDGTTLIISGTVSSSVGNIGGFTIDSDEIKAGSTLILDSDSNSGEIKLGAASDMTTGDGIYMAGNEKFRVGQASDNFLRFGETADTLEIKTDSLDLDSSGNLTISGTISSSVGNIGGFNIGKTKLSTAGFEIGNEDVNFALSSSKFQVTHDGRFTASDASVSGVITASAGLFSGNVTSEATMSGGVVNTSTGNDRVEVDGNANDIKFFQNNIEAIQIGKLGAVGKSADDEYGVSIKNQEAKLFVSKSSSTFTSLGSYGATLDTQLLGAAIRASNFALTDTGAERSGLSTIHGELITSASAYDDVGMFGAVVGKILNQQTPFKSAGVIGLSINSTQAGNVTNWYKQIPIKPYGVVSVGDSLVSGSLTVFGNELIVSGNITSLETITAEQLTSTDDLTIAGDINANGNIIGDESTNITKINELTASKMVANVGMIISDIAAPDHFNQSIATGEGQTPILRLQRGTGGSNGFDFFADGSGNFLITDDVGSNQKNFIIGVSPTGDDATDRDIIFKAGKSSGNLIERLRITGTGHVSASGVISASSFVGNGSGLTGISAGTLDIDGLSSLGGTGVAQSDKFVFSDAGTEKSITFSNLEDAIFGNVSGDATIAAGGALTIGANAVEGSMLNSNVAGTGLDYGSNELSVDVSDFMANGGNDKVVTSTGTDGMRAEDNLTFNSNSQLTIDGQITASGVIAASAFSGSTVRGTPGLFLVNNSGAGMRVAENDNIGIGNTGATPPKTLTVAGDISASQDIFLEAGSGIKFANASNTRIRETNSHLELSGDEDVILAPDDDVEIKEGTQTYAIFRGGERRLEIEGDISSSGDILFKGASVITASNHASIKFPVQTDTIDFQGGVESGLAKFRFINTVATVADGDTFMQLSFRNNDAQDNAARIQLIATENHAPGSAGSKFVFQAFGNTADSTDAAEITTLLTLDPDEGATFPSTVSASGFIGSGDSFNTGSYDFPGAIMGYNVQGLNAGHQSVNLSSTMAVIDDDLYVQFVAPKSGIVEIFVQALLDGNTAATAITVGLSTQNKTDGYNALASYYEQVNSDYDETDDAILHHMWVIQGLTPGTNYQYWFAAKCANTFGGIPKINWGGSSAGRNADFIMKATALPSNTEIN